MVEINNQRKAFLDMLAWFAELITTSETRNQAVMTSLQAESYLLITWSPSQTCHKLQNSNRYAGRYQLLSRWWMSTASSLAWKDFSPKSQDAVALQQIKERGALPMIDRGDIRQAIDRCSNIWASLLGAGYGQFEHKYTAWLQKFKEAGGTVREIDVWAESLAISPSSGYLHHRLPVMGC